MDLPQIYEDLFQNKLPPTQAIKGDQRQAIDALNLPTNIQVQVLIFQSL